MHSHIGLEPRWYVGGYTFVLGRLYIAASQEFTSRLRPAVAQAKTAALMGALNQAAMLDIDIAISIYIEENQASQERKLTKLADAFAAKIGPLVADV